ncbi:hypothetical protein NDU88_006467 [Pleurodeles waltl]|uniref:Uncharacterized protein n=1 Tax=Pleurodeles waltl TaxID=8319 RepID=A0AAV7TFP2_PLEWA|nr:hypothetical protein NDU88_006467 [Pleurodeles waltl]
MEATVGAHLTPGDTAENSTRGATDGGGVRRSRRPSDYFLAYVAQTAPGPACPLPPSRQESHGLQKEVVLRAARDARRQDEPGRRLGQEQAQERACLRPEELGWADSLWSC